MSRIGEHTMNPQDPHATRRALLRALALTGASAVAGCTAVSVQSAPPSDDVPPVGDAPVMGGDGPPLGGDAGMVDADIDALNALLTRARRHVEMYRVAMMALQNPPSGDPQAAFGPVLQTIVGIWMEHGTAHAAALSARVTALGGTPADPREATFSLPRGYSASVRNALAMAHNAEKSAAVGFATVAGALRSPRHRALAADVCAHHTQCFTILYGLLHETLAPVPVQLIQHYDALVPKGFVASADGTPGDGLDALADFTYSG